VSQSVVRFDRANVALQCEPKGANALYKGARGREWYFDYMTRYKTYLPRSTTSKCVVCRASTGTGCHERTRIDILGRVMCSKHGQTSRRFTDKRLFALHPRLYVLLRARRDLTFLRSAMLDHGLLAQLVRYPSQSAPTLPFILPAPRNGPRPRHRRRRKAECAHSACCGLCACSLGKSPGGRRPWGDDLDLCRACHARASRQHERAATQFEAIVTFIRQKQGSWLVPLLSSTLRARVVQVLAQLRPRRLPLDRERFV